MADVNELYTQLVERAKELDWYYAFSDDFRVYERGEKASDEFKADFKKLYEMSPDLAIKLNIEFVPEMFDLIKRIRDL